MTKKITVSDDTYALIKEQAEKDVEKKEEKRFEIKNRFTGNVIYTSTKTTYKDAVQEAVNSGANLRDANLRDADLCGADLRGADLRGADLMNVKFYGKGGTKVLKKAQVTDFLKALGFVVEE